MPLRSIRSVSACVFRNDSPGDTAANTHKASNYSSAVTSYDGVDDYGDDSSQATMSWAKPEVSRSTGSVF